MRSRTEVLVTTEKKIKREIFTHKLIITPKLKSSSCTPKKRELMFSSGLISCINTGHNSIRNQTKVPPKIPAIAPRSEEHTSELQSRPHLVCRLLLEKKKKKIKS